MSNHNKTLIYAIQDNDEMKLLWLKRFYEYKKLHITIECQKLTGQSVATIAGRQ